MNIEPRPVDSPQLSVTGATNKGSKTPKEGLIPNDPNYKGALTREQAEKKLSDAGDYLLRFSEKQGRYVVSFKDPEGKCSHSLINSKEGYLRVRDFVKSGRYYGTLTESEAENKLLNKKDWLIRFSESKNKHFITHNLERDIEEIHIPANRITYQSLKIKMELTKTHFDYHASLDKQNASATAHVVAWLKEQEDRE